MGRLMIVDADADFREVVAYVLAREGHRTVEAQDLSIAERMLATHNFDLVLLAPCYLEGKPMDFCARLRHVYGLPTIVLAERESGYDAVRCLDAGAEDFLHKPCDFGELAARVRAALRRQGRRSHEEVVAGPLQIDRLRREVRYGERVIQLGPIECRLLEELVSRAGHVVPSDELLRRVWQSDSRDTELLRVTIYRLRRKLGGNCQHDSLIRSIPGVGFMFDPHVDGPAAKGRHVGT